MQPGLVQSTAANEGAALTPFAASRSLHFAQNFERHASYGNRLGTSAGNGGGGWITPGRAAVGNGGGGAIVPGKVEGGAAEGAGQHGIPGRHALASQAVPGAHPTPHGAPGRQFGTAAPGTHAGPHAAQVLGLQFTHPGPPGGNGHALEFSHGNLRGS